MKRVIYLFMAICMSTCIYAQSDQPVVVDVNILKDSQSPAAAILGISSTDIPRPSDPTAFMLSLKQASDNFSQIPVNYAVDISPIWMFCADKIKAEQYLSNNIIHNIPQSFVLSLGFNNNNVQNASLQSIPNTSLGFGVKFSFLRGNVSDSTMMMINKSINLSKKRNKQKSEIEGTLKANSAEWKRIDQAFNKPNLTQSEIDTLTAQGQIELARINDEAENQLQGYAAQYAAISQGLDFTRTGFKLDFNAAFALAFPERVFDEGNVNKIGAWLTGGYEGQGGFSFLGIVRYLYNPDAIYLDDKSAAFQENLNLLQSGVRLLYNKNKFSFSFEALRQNILNSDDLNSSYKYLLNTEYQLVDNMKLSLTFGRDYDGMISKDGTVISALNFLMGLGSARKLAEGS